MVKNENVKNGVIFPAGPKNDAYAKYFVGQSYLQGLVNDPAVNVGLATSLLNPSVAIIGIFTTMAIKFCWSPVAKAGIKRPASLLNT